MKVEQWHVSGAGEGFGELPGAHLVLCFGAVALLDDPSFVASLRERFPGAALAGCSTAGEIDAGGVADDGAVITAVRFDRATARGVCTPIPDMADSRAAGLRLAEALSGPGLVHVLVYAPGVEVNGSALVEGLRQGLPPGVTVSGGLAGDGGAFARTLTLHGGGVDPRGAVAVGLFGDSLVLGHGSNHGWVPFGPLRKVTRSAGNLLYELDGEPALEVYKRYLGDYAKDLPASGLLFPFEMVGEGSGPGLIRTILGVDEAEGRLTLAGDVDPDGHLRLMHATTDSLVDGAQTAADRSSALAEVQGDRLALLVSCVGRKLVMGPRVDEEVEAVADSLGKTARLAGFYSYGEISPHRDATDCRLHNQTMTVTHLGER